MVWSWPFFVINVLERPGDQHQHQPVHMLLSKQVLRDGMQTATAKLVRSQLADYPDWQAVQLKMWYCAVCHVANAADEAHEALGWFM